MAFGEIVDHYHVAISSVAIITSPSCSLYDCLALNRM